MCRMISALLYPPLAINSLGTFVGGHCTHVKNLKCISRLVLGKLVSFHFQPAYSLAFPVKFFAYIFGEKESDSCWNGWVKKTVHLCSVSLSTF